MGNFIVIIYQQILLKENLIYFKLLHCEHADSICNVEANTNAFFHFIGKLCDAIKVNRQKNQDLYKILMLGGHIIQKQFAIASERCNIQDEWVELLRDAIFRNERWIDRWIDPKMVKVLTSLYLKQAAYTKKNKYCGNPICKYFQKSNNKENESKIAMKICGGCKLLYFCSKKCQKICWNRFNHKFHCMKLRK